MKTEIVTIANLKCSGCENTIVNKLSNISGVKTVVVDLEKEQVTIGHDGTTDRNHFAKVLSSLGYPEATEENGLLLKLKSYASCMVGKLNKD